jgi:hypothetical protein
MPISSAAKPKNLTSLTEPSAIKGEASILPLPAVTPDAYNDVPFDIVTPVAFLTS